LIEAILQSPQQIIFAYGERQIYQSKVEIRNKLYLVHVIIEPADLYWLLPCIAQGKLKNIGRTSDEDNIRHTNRYLKNYIRQFAYRGK
jgi:hypothetical protein